MTETNENQEHDIAVETEEVRNARPPAGPGIILNMMFWGLIFGLVGFLGGFFGPIFLKPAANQGPLLGIFITGPLGVIIGCLFGAVRTFRKQ
jgi:hypothetical protein